MFKNLFKDIFKMNRNPISWEKAIVAAICGALPILIGLLLNQIRYGILASTGGFVYLYVFNEPYAQRLKKMFFIAIGMTLSVTLGILVKPYPLLVIFTVGIIGFIVIYVFGVLKVAGPGPVFFVLAFTMFTGIDLSKQEIPLVIFLIFLVSMMSVALSMIGYFFNPHGVELKKMKQVYSVLAQFAESIGSDDIASNRNRVVTVLKEAHEIIAIGHMPRKNSYLFNKLVLLNEHANMLFLEMLKINVETSEKLPVEIVNELKKISLGISYINGKEIEIKIKKIKVDSKTYNKLINVIYDIGAIIDIEEKYIGTGIDIVKPSVMRKLIKSFSKDSIIFSYSIRYGIVLGISSAIAYQLDVVKPYWIPLSCAAVMCGPTVASTLNRGIQRSLGTILGILLSLVILSVHPQGLLLIIFNFCLTVLIELTIAQNYALAAIFITPNAILVSENSTRIFDTLYFAGPRITNILIGSLIGVLGTYIISYKSASRRFNYLIAELLRSHARALVYLKDNDEKEKINIIREKINMDYVNLKTTYISALGEFSKSRKRLETLWPAFLALEHMSYLLCQYCIQREKLILNEEELADLVLVYVRMANDIEQQKEIKYQEIKEIEQISELCKELNIFQEAYIIR